MGYTNVFWSFAYKDWETDVQRGKEYALGEVKKCLHDGAVIIRDGRIDSAGCVLPMTSRVDIPKDLGTRHRASIGTTEITDAVVVIVSEETGIISISINGELERGFTYTTLRTRLEEILNPIKDSNSKKKKKRRKKNKGGANTVAKADVNANKGENADNAK